MNEDHQYYEHCMTRKRNNGLYTSDQVYLLYSFTFPVSTAHI